MIFFWGAVASWVLSRAELVPLVLPLTAPDLLYNCCQRGDSESPLCQPLTAYFLGGLFLFYLCSVVCLRAELFGFAVLSACRHATAGA